MADRRDDWLRLCAALGVPADAARRAFDRLAAAYASPGRFYHTPEHVGHVLQILDDLRHHAGDFAALQLAAWFHDAVYDPRAGDNEERSAALAETLLAKLGVAAETVAEVRRLILLTKTHSPDEADADGRLLVDADLAILGAPPDEYRRYAAAIRQEYAWVPDEAYRAGRAAVLEGFLRRPRIYHTAEMRGLEEAARRNLADEVRSPS